MKRLTTDEFITKCIEKHGYKFDYTKTKYKNTRSKITLICFKHGEFKIQASNHLHNGQGCWECFLDNHKLLYLSDDRLGKIKSIHNNKYQYLDRNIYQGFINIVCPEHSVFTQYLYFHEYGHGCPDCNLSKGEEKIKSILIKNNIDFYMNYKFDDCMNIRKLRFDFWVPIKNTIIEYDGEHHFKENKYFGEGNLEYMKNNDDIKNKYCSDKKINLIRIPYFDFNQVEEILSKKLFNI
jgi:hypothetical protein